MDSESGANEREVERTGHRTGGPGSGKCFVIPSAARIAADLRAAARAPLLARAMQKLRSGELDSEAVAAATARRLLAAKILSA